METLNNIITVVNDFLWTYILVIALIVPQLINAVVTIEKIYLPSQRRR